MNELHAIVTSGVLRYIGIVVCSIALCREQSRWLQVFYAVGLASWVVNA